jgi:hypothetical protein
MTSTRNKNTPGDYYLEQRDYKLANEYELYKYSQYGKAYKNALPCLGFNPSQMPRETFAYNAIEIESALFGINSTNLVKPQAPVIPEQKSIPTIKYFETVPLFMPAPLVIENKQRPYPI